MKVSVIVPVYKVEKYIERCIQSLVNQTLRDIEIILVNDCTPDNSYEVCKEYAKKYKNIVLINKKKNTGLSDTRNEGIKVAKGEYIAFVDSDDYVDIDMYEKMYNKAIENDFDIVVCDAYLEYLDGNICGIATSNLEKDIVTKAEIKKYMTIIYPSAWNKIYKKELLTLDNYFKVGAYFEDVEFIYRLLSKVGKIGVLKEPKYHYIQAVPGAITGTYDRRLYHYIDNFDDVIKYYKNHNIFDDYYDELEYSYVRYAFATFIKRSKNYNKEEYKKAVNYALNKVKENFPNYRNNPYLKLGLKNIYLKKFNKFIANIYYLFRRKK